MTWWSLVLAWTAISVLVALGYTFGVTVGRRRGYEDAAMSTRERRSHHRPHEHRLTG